MGAIWSLCWSMHVFGLGRELSLVQNPVGAPGGGADIYGTEWGQTVGICQQLNCVIC